MSQAIGLGGGRLPVGDMAANEVLALCDAYLDRKGVVPPADVKLARPTSLVLNDHVELKPIRGDADRYPSNADCV